MNFTFDWNVKLPVGKVYGGDEVNVRLPPEKVVAAFEGKQLPSMGQVIVRALIKAVW